MTEFVCNVCGWKKKESLGTLFSDVDVRTCSICYTDTVQSSNSDYSVHTEYVIIYPGYR